MKFFNSVKEIVIEWHKGAGLLAHFGAGVAFALLVFFVYHNPIFLFILIIAAPIASFIISISKLF